MERLIQRLYEGCRDEDNRTCGERGEALLCDDCETAVYLRLLQESPMPAPSRIGTDPKGERR
jgi:hypothetical protein